MNPKLMTFGNDWICFLYDFCSLKKKKIGEKPIIEVLEWKRNNLVSAKIKGKD